MLPRGECLCRAMHSMFQLLFTLNYRNLEKSTECQLILPVVSHVPSVFKSANDTYFIYPVCMVRSHSGAHASDEASSLALSSWL